MLGGGGYATSSLVPIFGRLSGGASDGWRRPQSSGRTELVVLASSVGRVAWVVGSSDGVALIIGVVRCVFAVALVVVTLVVSVVTLVVSVVTLVVNVVTLVVVTLVVSVVTLVVVTLVASVVTL